MANWSEAVAELGRGSHSFAPRDAPFRDAVTLLGEMRWEEALRAWKLCYGCFETSYLSKTVFVDLSIRLGRFDDAWMVIDGEECFASPHFPLRGIWRKTKELWNVAGNASWAPQRISEEQAGRPAAILVHRGIDSTDLISMFERRRYDLIVSSVIGRQSSFISDPDAISIYLKSLFALGRYDDFLREFKEYSHCRGSSASNVPPDSMITDELLDIKTRVDVRLHRRSDSIPTHVQRFKASLAYRHTESMLLRCEDLTVQGAILNELAAFNRIVGIFGDGFRPYSV